LESKGVKSWRCLPNADLEVLVVDADLDTLATALYVTADDLLTAHPERVPARPRVGIVPKISDAEVVTLAVMQALLGYTSESRWLRYARARLLPMFPALPQQSGYNKRLRTLAPTLSWLIGALGALTRIAGGDVWVVDSTPVECARSRDTVQRSNLAGWAEYGYCASHSGFFWGLRLHLVCTLHGLPVGWALTGAKATNARRSPRSSPTPGRCKVRDPGGRSRSRTRTTSAAPSKPTSTPPGSNCSPGPQGRETPARATLFFKPLRQVIESINQTPKGQLDLERHGGKSIAGVCARFAQRVLAMTAAIWHNDHLGGRIKRSLTA